MTITDYVAGVELWEQHRRLPRAIAHETARKYRADYLFNDILQNLELHFWRYCLEYDPSRVRDEHSNFGAWMVQRLRWRAQEFLIRDEKIFKMRSISLDEEIETAKDGVVGKNLDILEMALVDATTEVGDAELRALEHKQKLWDSIRWDVLNSPEQEIIRLRLQGLSREAIAERLNSTVRSVTVTAANAIRKLRYAVTHPPEKGLEGKRRGGQRSAKKTACLRFRIRRGKPCVCGYHTEAQNAR